MLAQPLDKADMSVRKVTLFGALKIDDAKIHIATPYGYH